MQRLQSSVPPLALQPYVRAYAQRQLHAEPAVTQPVVASLEQVLQFEFGVPLTIDYRDGRSEACPRIVVVGCHSYQRASIRFDGFVESFAVFFQPLGMWQIFGVPSSELRDRAFAGSDVLGAAMLNLWQRMAEAGSFAERVRIMNAFLIRRARTARCLTSVMLTAVEMFRAGGAIRIQDAASDAGMNLRQFQRKFAADTGLSPKLFARISRFQMALDAKLRHPEVSWLRIAHAFEYHDQMHLIHDFHELAGVSPAKLLAQLGDGRPDALTDATPLWLDEL